MYLSMAFLTSSSVAAGRPAVVHTALDPVNCECRKYTPLTYTVGPSRQNSGPARH